jgi:hypothetical protein
MLLPAIGFLASFGFFALVGAILLRLQGARPIRLVRVIAFALAGQAGLLLFAAAYGRVFADPGGTLGSRSVVIGFLLGMPLAGIGAGLLLMKLIAAHADDPTKR